MDETTVQVMGEENRPDTSKSYMWLARGGPPESALVIYEYHETRSSQHAKAFLEGYAGYLQTDGYQAYETALDGNNQIVHVGCLAHARRKFVEATKASKKAGSAQMAVQKIKKIYRDLTQDKNAVERAVRPFVVGSNNWLFSGSPNGARASSLFYSLIETAKADELTS